MLENVCETGIENFSLSPPGHAGFQHFIVSSSAHFGAVKHLIRLAHSKAVFFSISLSSLTDPALKITGGNSWWL